MLIKRIPFEHMQAIFAEGLHAKGSGADRPGIERYVVGSQSRLCIKALCFLRHRCEKGHREPIGKLGVFAVNADFQRMVVNNSNSLKGLCHQIKKCLFRGAGITHGPPLGVKPLFKIGKTHNA